MNDENRTSIRRLFGPGLLTVALLAVLVSLNTLTEFAGEATPDAIWLYATESLFTFLPIAAALLAGQVARLNMKSLAAACALITALMVAQDFLPPSELTATKRDLVYVPVSDEWTVRETFDLIRWTEGMSFPLVAAYVTGNVPEANVRAASLPEGAARIQVAWAMFKFGYLLAPFVVVGFVVATRVWLRRNVRFRTRSRERVFAFLVSWLVGPIVLFVLVFAGVRTVMWGVGPWGPGAILIPYVVFGSTAAFGWLAGIRAQRAQEYIDAVPVDE